MRVLFKLIDGCFIARNLEIIILGNIDIVGQEWEDAVLVHVV